jgi:hypothetical protein
MSDKRYYTPKIEEFHVGFEYESATLKRSDPWLMKTATTQDIVEIEALLELYPEGVRVKYLDEEDIVSLGWEVGTFVDIFSKNETTEYREGFGFEIGEFDNIIMLFDQERSYTQIYKQHIYNENSGNWTSEVLFQGVVLNLSRLRLVMEMLGITKQQ